MEVPSQSRHTLMSASFAYPQCCPVVYLSVFAQQSSTVQIAVIDDAGTCLTLIFFVSFVVYFCFTASNLEVTVS